jgi:hypothetical protein
LITVVTKSDSAVVTDSKYSRDDLSLPSFGGIIRGKIKRGGSPPIWLSSIYYITYLLIRIHFGLCRSALIEPQYLSLPLFSIVYGFQVCLLIPVLLR